MGSIVLSLDVHCMRTIRNILSNCLNDDDNIVLVYKTIVEYLDEKRIPVNTVEELLNHILKEAPQLGAEIRFSSLQLMLRKQIKRLAIGVFPSAYHETILEVVIKQGLNLSVLDLSGIWIREDQPVIAEILAEMGKKFCKLIDLTLPYIIMNDNLMKALGNFSNLISLQCPGDYTSISFDTFVTNLSKLKKLQWLNIGYGKIDEHELQLALAKVLNALNSLKSFQEYGFVGKVLGFYQNLVPKQVLDQKKIQQTKTIFNTFIFK